jgi:very-short-patch-repair endonuclease
VASSTLESTFDYWWRILAADLVVPVEEHYFAKPRRFRFDRAFLVERVAVELEGGTWGKSRHTSGSGYARDCAKYNLATAMGWRVLRYTTDMLTNDPAACVEQIRQVLALAPALETPAPAPAGPLLQSPLPTVPQTRTDPGSPVAAPPAS